MLELRFVLDNRYTQLDRFGVFLFRARVRETVATTGRGAERTLMELAMENSRGRMSGKRSKMYSLDTLV